jgi:hypothetical protein
MFALNRVQEESPGDTPDLSCKGGRLFRSKFHWDLAQLADDYSSGSIALLFLAAWVSYLKLVFIARFVTGCTAGRRQQNWHHCAAVLARSWLGGLQHLAASPEPAGCHERWGWRQEGSYQEAGSCRRPGPDRCLSLAHPGC